MLEIFESQSVVHKTRFHFVRKLWHMLSHEGYRFNYGSKNYRNIITSGYGEEGSIFSDIGLEEEANNFVHLMVIWVK